jgi:DNA-binding NarL/FixJ family response regulator
MNAPLESGGEKQRSLVMSHQVKLFVVDGDRLFREALAALVASWPGYALVGEAGSVTEARVRLGTTRADIVLLDIELPMEPGFALLRHLQREARPERALVLSREVHLDYVEEAMRLGAAGYLSRSTDSEQLRGALQSVLQGKTVLDPALRKAMNTHITPGCITDRECQVMTLIAQGACNAQIARSLRITEKTVKSHVSSLLDKLGVPSRVHLALYGQDTSLLSPSLSGTGKPTPAR